MDTKDVALAVEAWTGDVTGFNTFPDQPEDLNAALPIAIAGIRREQTAERNADFSYQQYEQSMSKALTIEVMLLVAPDPPWTADQSLYDAVDQLGAALRSDVTLGNRITAASRTHNAEYIGEVQHEDGTVFRAATFSVIVGEQVEVN